MIAALAINISLVAIAVVIHYEMLRLLSVLIPRLRIKHRLRVLIGVFGTICAHIIEICLFGLAFYLMVRAGGFGDLAGSFDGSLVDSIYFSLPITRPWVTATSLRKEASASSLASRPSLASPLSPGLLHSCLWR
jgi:hypothetical protein